MSRSARLPPCGREGVGLGTGVWAGAPGFSPTEDVSPPSTGPALTQDQQPRSPGPAHDLVGSCAVAGLLPAGTLTGPTAPGDMERRGPHPLS